MSRAKCAIALLALAAALGLPGLIAALAPQDEFDHEEHAGMFPSCQICHEGIERPSEPLYPAADSCESCHDGETEDRVDWSPPTMPPLTNLDFDHSEHVTAAVESPVADCTGCHAPSDAPWMTVHLAESGQCLDCHEVDETHLAVVDEECITCHLSLPEAARLPEERIAAFEAPPSHEPDGFILPDGHGAVAGEQSCTICHARDYCVECHVDAPEQPSIQELEPDARALAIPAVLAAPADHDDPHYLAAHGVTALEDASGCITCHTQGSCRTCHVATGGVASALHAAGPGRGAGAQTTREPPATHDGFYRFSHAGPAAAGGQTCAGCHAREDCLECHRPDPASGPPGYHTSDWLARHPAGAWARESSCSDCHNPRGFCATCHAEAGMAARTGTIIGAGFHDGQPAFVSGHGQAARQSLESCVTCHAERDCTTCHSATRGRGINPHGPGFDAERLRESAPSMCTACHGASIPGG